MSLVLPIPLINAAKKQCQTLRRENSRINEMNEKRIVLSFTRIWKAREDIVRGIKVQLLNSLAHRFLNAGRLSCFVRLFALKEQKKKKNLISEIEY